MYRFNRLAASLLLALPLLASAQKKNTPPSVWGIDTLVQEALAWRNIGPTRGGRSNAVTGVPGNPLLYYMGSTGGGIWKTEDAGISWKNISDGFFRTGSVGAIAVAPSDPNILYVGMGEHAVRGVMTSAGDGIYKSLDGGKSWKHTGLPASQHIAGIRIHPTNPDLVYVAVQGALYGPSADRGIYRSADGGLSWKKIHFVNELTGCSDLSMDPSNPRILYAGMWEHQRKPWVVISGGQGSGFFKSTDGGDSWQKLTDGLPSQMGKTAISVSPANPSRVYALLEAEGDKGGVYRSEDGGLKWSQVNKNRVTVARAWYYINIFADPKNPDKVYVLNAPTLKSIDGGKSFSNIEVPHGDCHNLWINPDNPDNMIEANDGGACISFNGGQSWSSQENQPTAQFYRVITDNRFPYFVYGGQQDNTTVAIASRTASARIGMKDWYEVAGGESAFIAFDPNQPDKVFAGSYQGNIDAWDATTRIEKDVMSYPFIGLAVKPADARYRFNWNAPIVADPHRPGVIYHAGNVVFRTDNNGQSWTVISQDLTRNDKSKQGDGGTPFTNEGAGGEVYNTISYLACSPLRKGEIWAGTDCGLVHMSTDDGSSWQNITPTGLGEALVNSIELSPHEPGTAYLAVTRYKFNDPSPLVYFTRDYGKSWSLRVKGISTGDFVRVVREDPIRKGLLYAGTETGMYISFNGGEHWQRWKTNLPAVAITDLTIRNNDLVAATSGRAFWILDDLGPVQQGNWEAQPLKSAKLFTPRPTVRWDVPAPTTPVAGQNPLNGVIIHYWLPEAMDSATLSLKVYDTNKKLLRTYNSRPDKKHMVYPGGPPPPQVIPAKKGLNRFNWDMRLENIPGVPNTFINGSYRGRLVAPGDYTLVLQTPTDSQSVSISIIADKRVAASLADYALQDQMISVIDSTVTDMHQSVSRMKQVKKQLEDHASLLKGKAGTDSLLKLGTGLLKEINQWEEKLITSRQQTFQDVINFYNRLNAELLDLKRRMDTHDPRVTEGAKQRYRDLMEEWAVQRRSLTEIIDVKMVAYNKLYRDLQLPALVLPE